MFLLRHARAHVCALPLWVATGCADLRQAPAAGDDDGSSGTMSSVTTLSVTTVTASQGGTDDTAGPGDGTSTGAQSDSTGIGATTTSGDDRSDTTTGDTDVGSECGNGEVDLAEECDGEALAGATCEDLLGFGGTLACTKNCTYDTSGCWIAAQPDAGEVIVSEIMQNPAGDDAVGEWFELHNPGLAPLDLGGCTIDGNESDVGFTIEASLPIGGGDFVTFAVASRDGPGFEPNHEWDPTDFGLNNTNDVVELSCDDGPVDTVAYDDGATFPDPDGASMTLSPMTLTDADNDVGSNWCFGSTPYAPNNLGTPGSDNDACP